MYIDEQTEHIEACRYCFLCRHACSVFEVTQRDTNSARGLAIVLSAVQRGILDWKEDVVEVLYQCTAGRRCRGWCEPGWDIAEAVLAARADIVEQGLAPCAAVAVRDKVEANDSPYGEPDENKVAFAPPDRVGRDGEVLYFAGCVTGFEEPEIARATSEVLERAGVDYGVLQDEPCCGAPFWQLGFRDEARAQAQTVAGRIAASGCATVVFSCPTCYRTIVKDYPQLGVQLDHGIRPLHITEYITELYDEKRLDLSSLADVTVTYQDPCHLGRGMEVYEPPRRVLTDILGANLTEMSWNRDKAHCCGSGSCMQATNPSLVAQVAGVTLDMARDTKAAILATACPMCKMTFSNQAEGMEVRDVTELVAQAISR
mgnify:CR=1 FL=1